jgi:hypothetical protein
MAITNNDVTFLFYCKKIGVSFKDTLMLGRLKQFAKKDYILNDIEKFSNLDLNINAINFKEEYSESFFKMLGADTINSIDYSDYEKASIIHDMNLPLSDEYDNRFSVIIDGGTIEHVFNFPIAIKNCMKALKVGGYYLGMTPANNLMGHGFYQFSPELFYRIFSPENGFCVIKMLAYATKDNSEAKNWYEVIDPKTIKNRVMLRNSLPTYILIIAKKMEEKEIFSTYPQQSDYVSTWFAHDDTINKSTVKETNILKRFFRKYIPKGLKPLLRKIYSIYKKDEVTNDEIGTFDSKHFEKFDP